MCTSCHGSLEKEKSPPAIKKTKEMFLEEGAFLLGKHRRVEGICLTMKCFLVECR